MPIHLDRYRMKDGVTPLSERYFNPVWQDIDLRIAELERLRLGWQEIVRQVSDLGLARINEVIGGPLTEANAAVEQMRAALASLPTLVDQSTFEAALAALNHQIDVIGDAIGTDPFPSMTGQEGKWLGTNGHARFWGAPDITSLGKGTASVGQLLGVSPAGTVVGLPNVVVVSSLANLRALAPAGDGQWAVWNGVGLYVYQQSADGFDDGELNIQPNTAAGRWQLQGIGWDMIQAMLATDLARIDEVELLTQSIQQRMPNRPLVSVANCTATSIAGGAYFEFTTACFGANVGDPVVVGPPDPLAAPLIYSATVSASDIVAIRICNQSASAVSSNVGYGNWNVLVLK